MGKDQGADAKRKKNHNARREKIRDSADRGSGGADNKQQCLRRTSEVVDTHFPGVGRVRVVAADPGKILLEDCAIARELLAEAVSQPVVIRVARILERQRGSAAGQSEQSKGAHSVALKVRSCKSEPRSQWKDVKKKTWRNNRRRKLAQAEEKHSNYE